MKTRTLVLLGMALSGSACGKAEPGPSSDPEAEESSLWPELEVPQGSGSTNSNGENPWLGGLGSTLSASGGGSPSLSGGSESASPGPASVEEPPKKSPVSSSGGAAAGPDSPDPDPSRPELLLSRYEESTGSEKRLEIENLGRAIGTNECSLSIFSNGNEKPFRSLTLDALSEGSSLRLCTTQVTDDACGLSLGASSFNGNDALVLSCGADIVDSLGRVGEDPGRGWSDGAARTWDATLLRCDHSPDTDPSDPVVLGRRWAPGPFEANAATLQELCAPLLGLGGAPFPQ